LNLAAEVLQGENHKTAKEQIERLGNKWFKEAKTQKLELNT
jgi:hypothetical protein